MTLEELRERIKNEVVLYEGELADWQWRQKGLVEEANELGISDFTRLVNDISRQLNRDFGKILDLKKKIVTIALQQQKKLSEADINQFVAEAERIQLSRPFVTEQWIPTILEALPAVPEAEHPVKPEPSAAPVAPSPAAAEPAPMPDRVEAVRKKIKSILDDYDKHIQAQSLKFLFKAVDYDEAALAEEIRRYLSDNYYASVNPPRGDTLKEKLISTDWRHLSWWEKETPKVNPEPSAYVKTPTGYTPAPNPAVSSTPPPWPPTAKPQNGPPEPPKKGGLSDAALIGLAVLSALILIWVVLRLTRGESEDEKPVRQPSKSRTSQHRSSRHNRKESASYAVAKTKKPSKGEKMALAETENPESIAYGEDEFDEDEPKSEKKLQKPDYDNVDDRVGEFGLRPAQKGKFWGYINDENTWVIEPQFDLAAPFNAGKASVELEGNQFFINRQGNRIRETN
ncbi:WG repeat-containing protein [Larkinella insperata]|uniref:WG repeat-containing protein n=1 Tax=Larkinella insperata TaxID=332158 RepID=A0ABW3QAB1_9BACT|nr:WG repeat-containing protein [Larkinella insperata]